MDPLVEPVKASYGAGSLDQVVPALLHGRSAAWVPEPVYRSSRAEVLSGFLRRRSIYLTAHFRDRYEVPARQNLHRLIARLGSESSTA